MDSEADKVTRSVDFVLLPNFESEVRNQLAIICNKLEGLSVQICKRDLHAPDNPLPVQPPRSLFPMSFGKRKNKGPRKNVVSLGIIQKAVQENIMALQAIRENTGDSSNVTVDDTANTKNSNGHATCQHQNGNGETAGMVYKESGSFTSLGSSGSKAQRPSLVSKGSSTPRKENSHPNARGNTKRRKSIETIQMAVQENIMAYQQSLSAEYCSEEIQELPSKELRLSWGSENDSNHSNLSAITGSDKSSDRPRQRQLSPGLQSQQSSCSGASRVSRRSRTAMQAQMWVMMEDADSSSFAQGYSWVMVVLIFLSTLTPLLEAINDWQDHKLVCAVVEMFFDSIYTVDIGLRFAVCPNFKAFFFSLYNVIDSLAIVVLVARCSVGVVLPTVAEARGVAYCLLVFLPSVRLLKSLRHMPNFALLWGAFKLAFETLPSLLFALAQITLMFAAAIYTCEFEASSMDVSDSVWMTIVTMTTVGYGDVVPTTAAGKFITSVLVIVSLLYMAVPLGLIGHAFTEVWADRHRILLVQRARDCISQWGYTADSLMGLFKHFDADGSGEIDLSEFSTMIEDMGIGMTDAMIEKLFSSFDKTHTNNISDVEFVQALFPTYCHVLETGPNPNQADPSGTASAGTASAATS